MVKKVQVNIDQCESVGRILKNLTINSSAYDREYLIFEADRETKLRAYLFSVAICHQTHRLINRQLKLAGFEYLEKVFVDLARNRSELLDPKFIAQESSAGLSSKLALLFTETGDEKDSTLDNIIERSQLLIEMCRKLLDNYCGRISTLLSMTKEYISGDKGIYHLLSDFKAYSDPFRKKSSLFVMFAQSAGLLNIKDPDEIVPIMDYHIQRVLLRLGCVEILDIKLKHALINQEKMDSDDEIRAACIEAVKQLALFSGHSSITIHDFLWPLGRSCCKEKPLCKTGNCDKSPCTFERFVNLPSHKNCLFQGVCKGSINEDYIKLWQPIVETHYY